MPKFDDVFVGSKLSIDRAWQLEQCVCIAKNVCLENDISFLEMISQRIAKNVVSARHKYFARAYATTKASLVTIGEAIDKDHTTVIYGLNKYRNKQKYNAWLAEKP